MNFFRKLVGKPVIVKGRNSLYRIIAIFGSLTVFIESIIWSLLCLISMLFYAMGAPHTGKNENLMSPYGYVFSITYYRGDFNRTDSCANVSPQGLFGFTTIYLVGSLHLILASILLLLVVDKWQNAQQIRQRITYWIISVFVMSLLEFATGLIFFIDFLLCSERSQHNVAFAAVTLSALFSKGFVLFAFNIFLSLSLFCIQYCGYSECPV